MPSFAENLAYLRAVAHASSFPNGEGGSMRPWETDWFYQDPAADGSPGPTADGRLNVLCRAYLGDTGAQARLRFGEAPDSALDDNLIEGGFAPNERQRLAIRRALESDISLIQGPPGTGKTETILNMVSCILARGATVAVVSTNGEAIANITMKVRSYGTGAGDGKTDNRTAGDTTPNRRRVFDAYAAIGKLENREAWNLASPDGPQFDVARMSGGRHNDRYDTGGWEPRITAADFLARRPFITSTIHSLKKCFRDGDDHQFDYVIMDEASQCTPALALLAMSSARHLVLVGDTEQLPPVYSASAEQAAAKAAEHAGIPVPAPGSPYAMQDADTEDGVSILAAAQAVFCPLGAPRTFLNEHFRCHPGIIGFCSDEIYAPQGEGLVIRTREYDHAVQTPIRIRWFEGDYWEPHRLHDQADAGDRGPGNRRPRPARAKRQASKENIKQIEIFMHEEWPQLRERLEADPSYSVRILSPFHGQLEVLHERLMAQEGEALVSRLFGSGGAEDAWEQTGLTIHKTQGQEYNAIYLLPVEDGDWDWPWSQGRSIINVAASRAKDELVVICSANLMSRETQLALTGTFVPPVPLPAPQGLSDEARARREERERFLQKLVDYVRRRCDPASPSFTGEMGFPTSTYAYGFHKSRLVSVFDREPSATAPHTGGAVPPAQRALGNAIAAMGLTERGIAVARAVPLSRCFSPVALKRRLTDDAEHDAPSKMTLVTDGKKRRYSHLDFVLFDPETLRIVLAIQVEDGSSRFVDRSRRDDSEAALARRQQDRRCMDAIVRDMGGRVLASNRHANAARTAAAEPSTFTLLHLSTNGSTALETECLVETHDASGPYTRAFMTIEQILDEQLGHNAPAGPMLDPTLDLAAHALPARTQPDEAMNTPSDGRPTAEPPSRHPQADPKARYIKALLQDWQEAGVLPPMRSQEANKLLAQAGLIEKAGGDWHVTPQGAALGIVECTAVYGGAKATRCLYPASCEQALLEILLRERKAADAPGHKRDARRRTR